MIKQSPNAGNPHVTNFVKKLGPTGCVAVYGIMELHGTWKWCTCSRRWRPYPAEHCFLGKFRI